MISMMVISKKLIKWLTREEDPVNKFLSTKKGSAYFDYPLY